MSVPSYSVSFWWRKILVPIDGSEGSIRAFQLAVDFAMRYGSKITVVHVCNECNNNKLKEIVKEIAGNKIEYEYKEIKVNLRDSSISNELLKIIVDENFDAVIMGARGTSTEAETNIGSTALSIAVNAPISVILVR
ncbi:MAG: universal stress protein [Sulfolobaceae archaeon]